MIDQGLQKEQEVWHLNHRPAQEMNGDIWKEG